MSQPADRDPIDDLVRFHLEVSPASAERLARRSLESRPPQHRRSARWLPAAALALLLLALWQRSDTPQAAELEIRVVAEGETAFSLVGSGQAVQIIKPSGQVMAIVAGGSP